MFMSTALFGTVGTEITDKSNNIETIFNNCNLNWTVEQDNIYSEATGVIPNTVVNYRSDTKQILGIVSESHYKIINNIDAFRFIDDLPDFEIDRVGMCNNGKQVFVVGKSSEKIELDNGDYIDQYLTFVHGHTGKQGIQLIISPIRMACTNQLNLMLQKADFKYSIKHSGKIEQKLTRVHKALEDNKVYMLELGNTLRDMTATQATITIEQFLDKLIPEEVTESGRVNYRRYEVIGTIAHIYNSKDDNQNYKGTQFGYLNAVADYVSHQNPRKYMEYTRENMFIESIQNNKMLNEAYKILKAA